MRLLLSCVFVTVATEDGDSFPHLKWPEAYQNVYQEQLADQCIETKKQIQGNGRFRSCSQSCIKHRNRQF